MDILNASHLKAFSQAPQVKKRLDDPKLYKSSVGLAP